MEQMQQRRHGALMIYIMIIANDQQPESKPMDCIKRNLPPENGNCLVVQPRSDHVANLDLVQP